MRSGRCSTIEQSHVGSTRVVESKQKQQEVEKLQLPRAARKFVGCLQRRIASTTFENQMGALPLSISNESSRLSTRDDCRLFDFLGMTHTAVARHPLGDGEGGSPFSLARLASRGRAPTGEALLLQYTRQSANFSQEELTIIKLHVTAIRLNGNDASDPA